MEPTLDNDSLGLATKRLLLGRPDAGDVAYPLWYAFSFPPQSSFGGSEPRPVIDWLEQRGWHVITDEELTGDGYWHVAAYRRDALDSERLLAINEELDALAKSFGGTFDGWDALRRGNGKWTDKMP